MKNNSNSALFCYKLQKEYKKRDFLKIMPRGMISQLWIILLFFLLISLGLDFIDFLYIGRIVNSEETKNGLLINRSSFGKATPYVSFKMGSDYYYESKYYKELNQCIDFINNNSLNGRTIQWFYTAPTVYTMTDLKPVILAPSSDLVLFTDEKRYDTLRNPQFSDRNTVQTIASLFLTDDEEVIKNAFDYCNASYIIVTSKDLESEDSFLFSVFQGKYKEYNHLINESVLLNPQKKNNLTKIYADQSCVIYGK